MDRDEATIPLWATVVIGIAAVVITITADRIAVAGVTADLSARVEEQAKQNERVVTKLDDVLSKVNHNALVLQQVIDRQESVLKKLNLDGVPPERP